MGAPSNLGFNLDQTFFGFNPKQRVQFHEQLFDLLWYGEGRWSWDDIYNLPIHIRRLWITKINKKNTSDNTDEATIKARAKQQAKS